MQKKKFNILISGSSGFLEVVLKVYFFKGLSLVRVDIKKIL